MNKNPLRIKILVTGGTLDKEYDKIQGQLVFSESHINQMLRQARCRLDVSIETQMLKDSLYFEASDRANMLEKCRGFSEDRIIITHGTDTMAESAGYLASRIPDKTIVLFGAMIPFAFGDSDALFNFGTALAAVQSLPHGVYITMNGSIFSWENVRKNREEGYFEVLR